MHDIALQGTAHFCETHARGRAARQRRAARLRYDSFQLFVVGHGPDVRKPELNLQEKQE